MKYILCAFFLLFSFTGFTQKMSDKTTMENERKRLQQELKEIQAAYNSVKGKTKQNLAQLAALNKKIELQESYINNIGKEIRLIDDDIYYSAIEISRLKKQLDTLKGHYARTVVYAYKNRSNYDYLNFIFSANSFNDALRRVAYLKSYRNYRQKQMEDITKTKDLIAKRYDQQLTSKQKKTLALENRSSEYVALEKQKTEKDSVVAQLKSQSGDLQNQISKKKERDRELKNSIAAVVRKEIAEARKQAQAEAKKRAMEDALARERAAAARREKALAEAKAKQIATTAKPPATPTVTPPPTAKANEPKEEVAITPTTLKKSTKINEPVGSSKNIPTNNPAIAKAKPITLNKPTPAAVEETTAPSIVENKVPEGGYLNYKATDIALNSSFAQNRGRLPHPVDGVITLGFGRYKIEGMGPDIVGDNPGITYTANVGAPVRAIFEGEVASVSKVGGLSFVAIRHGKYFTVYSNLASVNVSKGATVSRGQTIGSVGADEETGSGKLDFILMIEERNVNPRAWLR